MVGAEDGHARSASTPALPPVAGAANGTQAQGARMMARRPTEPPQRRAFMSNLLNEDLQSLTKWHGSRPHHEQRRFLRSVDTLYKNFSKEPSGPSRRQVQAQVSAQAQAKAAAMEAAMAVAARASEEDPLNGPPRSPRENRAMLAASSSAPSLPSRPIDVFEQRKRESMQGDVDNLNTLDRWLEGGSVTTATTGTTNASKCTSLSQMTKTSSGGSSICSELGTTMQASFRAHKRAVALNRQGGQSNRHIVGALKDGIPNFGLPDAERLVTTFQDQYGSNPLGENIRKEMFEGVIRNGMHPFVSEYLTDATSEQKKQFGNMVRSLQYLRSSAENKNKTQGAVDYNLDENRRLWKPTETKAWVDKSQINRSQVPLGTLSQNPLQKVDENAQEVFAPPAPPPRQMAPPSPCVSGLGSMPLSRMSTPLMGGKHFPMASPPMPSS